MHPLAHIGGSMSSMKREVKKKLPHRPEDEGWVSISSPLLVAGPGLAGGGCFLLWPFLRVKANSIGFDGRGKRE